MKCRSCGAEIDAKAIVCYRCGTPTADPASLRPVPRPSPARAWWPWVVLLIVLAVAAFLYWRSLS